MQQGVGTPSMKPTTKFEQAYRELSRIASGPMDGEAAAEIGGAIKGSVSLLVAKAAQIAGRRELYALVPDMLAAFERFMVHGEKIDKGCNAKTAILEALNRLEHLDDSVFRTGAYYKQMEPAFGEPVDAAVDVRCQCAFGLARIGRTDAHYVLADLLVDPERAVRTATVKALAALGTMESEIMLRMRVLAGEKELEVVSECFSGLIAIDPERSLEFVSRYLRSGAPAMAEYAAIAIGSSHAPGAFEVLRRCWEEDPSPTMRRAILLPMALLRMDEGFGFLLGVVGHADPRTAAQAVSALGLYKDDSSIAKIHEVVTKRGDRAIIATFEGEFGHLDD